MSAGIWIRAMHRLHRALGSVLALLLAMWFASGAVMTFARYPTYTESERLAHAPSLLSNPALHVPKELRVWLQAGGLGNGSRARLSMIAEQPTWLFRDEAGRRRALPASDAHLVNEIDQVGVLRDLERRLPAKTRSFDVIEDFDQWTVGAYFRPWFPLLRVQLDDSAQTQLHVSLKTGEVVQQSTWRERLLAWLGPIPHWVYPAALRNHPAAWRFTVLTLSTLGLTLSLSGLIAGLHVLHVARRTRRRRGVHANALRDPYLRWHQRLGLLFGLFVSTWLFSGVLSLSPFEWSRGSWPDETELRSFHAVDVKANDPLPVAEALAACRSNLDVRELELVGFAGEIFTVCADGHGNTRLVNLRDSALTATAGLDTGQLGMMAQRSAAMGDSVDVALAYQADSYHYPTHHDQSFALPFARLSLHDREQTTYYLDPARLRVLARHTRATRLVRWLYHGLHSLDLPALYAQRAVWRSVVFLAMALGLGLSMLGFGMSARRVWRRLRLRSSNAENVPVRSLEGS